MTGAQVFQWATNLSEGSCTEILIPPNFLFVNKVGAGGEKTAQVSDRAPLSGFLKLFQEKILLSHWLQHQLM